MVHTCNPSTGEVVAGVSLELIDQKKMNNHDSLLPQINKWQKVKVDGSCVRTPEVSL